MNGFVVEKLWAFVSIGEDGDEGVCGFLSPDGMWIAMVCADRARVDSLQPVAEKLANATGRRIELRRFDGPVAVEQVFGE